MQTIRAISQRNVDTSAFSDFLPKNLNHPDDNIVITCISRLLKMAAACSTLTLVSLSE